MSLLHDAHVHDYAKHLADWALEAGGGFFQDAIDAFEYLSCRNTIPEEVGRYIRAWPCYPKEEA